MPEIIRQYGQTILVAIAGVMLVALLFVAWPSESGDGSVLTAVGETTTRQIADTSTGAGTAQFAQHASRTVPTIATTGTILQGEPFRVSDRIIVTDSDGAVWNSTRGRFVVGSAEYAGVVQVESIASSDGVEHVTGLHGTHTTEALTIDQSIGQITFLRPGIYHMRIRALDRSNVEATYTIPVVVDFVVQD